MSAIQAALRVVPLILLLSACETADTEDLCADLGWEPGTPQYEDCLRRAEGRSGGRSDPPALPKPGPRKLQQRGF
ncbi:MAG: hypothetical protein MI920_20920 [Kiloniellales bacterium]|nr:hypothetical protein [Kiloniellales bacterium]